MPVHSLDVPEIVLQAGTTRQLPIFGRKIQKNDFPDFAVFSVPLISLTKIGPNNSLTRALLISTFSPILQCLKQPNLSFLNSLGCCILASCISKLYGKLCVIIHILQLPHLWPIPVRFTSDSCLSNPASSTARTLPFCKLESGLRRHLCFFSPLCMAKRAAGTNKFRDCLQLSLTCAPPASLRTALLEAQTVRLMAKTAKATKPMLLAMLVQPTPERALAAMGNALELLMHTQAQRDLLGVPLFLAVLTSCQNF